VDDFILFCILLVLPDNNTETPPTIGAPAIASVFGRLSVGSSPWADFNAVPNVTETDIMRYWETDIVGGVNYPEGVGG